MCISHGNSDPKRSFSLNKTPLNVRGALIREETIEAVWFVKKFIIRNGGLANIQVTGSMIRSWQNARQRYETHVVENEKTGKLNIILIYWKQFSKLQNKVVLKEIMLLPSY